jgi:hypothetical protein
MRLSAGARLVDLKGGLFSAVCAAFALGLSAHLLATSAWHHGSLRDFGVLLVSVALLIAGGRRQLRCTNVLLFAAVGAAVIALSWPMIEGGIPAFAADALQSLCWALPILLVFLCSVFVFAQESLSVIRALSAIAILIARDHNGKYVASEDPDVTAAPMLQRWFSRRGPPQLLLSQPIST